MGVYVDCTITQDWESSQVTCLLQFSSAAQSCLNLCYLMNCSMPGLPVHHHLPEFTQTHIHQVSDAIQPSHPLSSSSPLPSIFPSIKVFSSESVLPIRWSKYWSFSFSISPSSEYSGTISFKTGWISLISKGLSSVFSNTTVQKRQFFMLSFLYSPILTFIHDYWEKHRFD